MSVEKMISRISKAYASTSQTIFRHRLAQEASLLAISQYLAAVLNMVTNILMARLLGPTDYGLVALIIAYPTLLWSFVGTKSVSVVTRYVAAFRAKEEPEGLKAIVKLGYGLDFFVSLLAFILVAISSWWVSQQFYRQPHLAWLMVVYAGSFPLFALTGASWAVLSSWERFRLLAVLEILQALLKLCLITGFLLAGFNVAGAVVGMGLAQASIGLIMMVAATTNLCRNGVGPWWKASLRRIAKLKRELGSFFSWNYLLVTLSGLVAQVPVMFLGRLRGSEEAGFYRIAVNIGTAGSYFETSLGRVAYPELSARWSAGEGESLKSSLKRWTLRAGLPAGVFLMLVIPFLHFLVPLLFGPEYRPMVLGAQVMMLGVAVSTVFFWLNSFYYASGKIRLWVGGYAFYALVVIGTAWLLIMKWGFLALAGVVSGGRVLFVGLMLLLLSNRSVEVGKMKDSYSSTVDRDNHA